MQIKFIDRTTGKIQIETPPAEGLLKFLYDNPFGKTAILPIAKRKFISSWYGNKMNRPNSAQKIQAFVDQLSIDMSEAEKKVEEFTSFNDFFYRKLKASARPIGNDFVSPGDGKLIAFENVADIGKFYVKGNPFTLTSFLDDKELAAKFANSTLLILRLAPNDYHRFHFPLSGTPSAIHQIAGSYYSVSPHALVGNFARVFCQNKREYCILDTPNKGAVLLAPVGATMVGGIIETYTPNQPVQKGDEMGYFAFGGSSVLMLVDKNKIKIDADILENSRNQIETFVKMGEKIGA
jgi:phosphatidylserine decarboxylase